MANLRHILWRQDDIVPSSKLSGACDLFMVQLRFEYLLRRHGDGGDVTLDVVQQQMYFPRDLFLEVPDAYISRRLSCLPLTETFKERVICRISNFAKKLQTDPQNAGHKILPMVLAICIFVCQQDDEDEDSAMGRIKTVMERNIRTSEYRWVPAKVPPTKSAIQAALDKVRVIVGDDLGSIEPCAICLEKPLAGVEISHLPCSHIYHWDCIVQWLKKSSNRCCPLCRCPIRR